MDERLLQGVLIGLSAGFSPGPLLALFSGRAARFGWQRTLPAAFAPLLSDGPIILITFLLLSQLPDSFIAILQLSGGFFLLYLAQKSFRQPALPESAADAPDTSLRDAALINLLNPNPYIFWGTVLGPTITALWWESPTAGLSYAAGFYLALITCFILWIVTFGSAGRIAPQIQRYIGLLSGIGMAGLGIWQLFAGFRSIASL